MSIERVLFQRQIGSCYGAMAREVATLATAATTYAERGLEHGDKGGDSRHFLPIFPGVLDRLFEWV